MRTNRPTDEELINRTTIHTSANVPDGYWEETARALAKRLQEELAVWDELKGNISGLYSTDGRYDLMAAVYPDKKPHTHAKLKKIVEERT